MKGGYEHAVSLSRTPSCDDWREKTKTYSGSHGEIANEQRRNDTFHESKLSFVTLRGSVAYFARKGSRAHTPVTCDLHRQTDEAVMLLNIVASSFRTLQFFK